LREKTAHLTRYKVAREAALLLYTQQEKEYKQAKQRAARNLGTRALPSNQDIAHELDKISDEMEGTEKKERLVQMRKEALSIMVLLGEFHPRLVGSVWRGTAHKNSDIDIEVFASDNVEVLQRLQQRAFAIRKAEWQLVTKEFGMERAFHIYVVLPSGYEVELVVRDPEKIEEVNKCEIHGDTIKGLDIHQLRRVLLMNPQQKFVPA